jgi:hypothetical protein
MTEYYDKKWNMNYEKLVKFKRTNGHCMVPRRYEQDKSLGEWVSKQRKVHNNNTIRLDRKRILDQIGFAWKADAAHQFKPDDKLWLQQHEKLVEYKRINGNCKVPRRYEQDKSLGEWVTKQRKVHNNNTIRLDRKRILDQIGFAWKADAAHQFNDKLWHQQYEQLVEYKRINSNLKVPKSNDKDKSLREWISTQRKHHNNNKMRPDRKELLDKIGFV